MKPTARLKPSLWAVRVHSVRWQTWLWAVGAFVPTQGPGNLQPLQQAEVILSVLDLSNKLTSQVMSVTHWPKLTRAL